VLATRLRRHGTQRAHPAWCRDAGRVADSPVLGRTGSAGTEGPAVLQWDWRLDPDGSGGPDCARWLGDKRVHPAVGVQVLRVFTFVLGNALGLAAATSLTRKLSRDGGNTKELIRDHTAKAREIARQFPRLRARLDAAAAADYWVSPPSVERSS
jgi:hypothetical protein